MRTTARYHKNVLELDQPLRLEEGERVVVEVIRADQSDVDWEDMALTQLEAAWDAPDDAIYDDWRTLYGVPAR